MLKSLKEVMYHNFYENRSPDLIRKINLPKYYDFGEMLDLFLEIHTGDLANPDPKYITVLCVTYTSFRIAIQKGFNAIYLFDVLDFTDTDYYTKLPIPSFGYVLLENADAISYTLIQSIHQQLPPSTYLFVFYDNFIPRKHMSYEDILPFYENVYEVSRISSDKVMMNVSIRHYLNFIRQKNNSLEKCLDGLNASITKEKIVEFDLSRYLDLGKVIITPNITILLILNNKIRNFLGLTNQEDPIKPQPNEWLIAERPIEVTETESGKKYILPIGYRFQVKECTLNRDAAYVIKFMHEKPDGAIVEVITYASKRYLEYMNYGGSELEHAPYSYCINYGYVVSSACCINNEFDDAIILFDGSLCIDKKELYAAIMPVKRNLTIYYSLREKIHV